MAVIKPMSYDQYVNSYTGPKVSAYDMNTQYNKYLTAYNKSPNMQPNSVTNSAGDIIVPQSSSSGIIPTTKTTTNTSGGLTGSVISANQGTNVLSTQNIGDTGLMGLNSWDKLFTPETLGAAKASTNVPAYYGTLKTGGLGFDTNLESFDEGSVVAQFDTGGETAGTLYGNGVTRDLTQMDRGDAAKLLDSTKSDQGTGGLTSKDVLDYSQAAAALYGIYGANEALGLSKKADARAEEAFRLANEDRTRRLAGNAEKSKGLSSSAASFAPVFAR